MNKNLRISIPIILLTSILLIWLNFNKNSNNHNYFEVEISDFQTVVNARGRVTPSQEVDLTSRVSSSVNNILVGIGDFVSEGQVLINLDREEIDDQIRELDINLSTQIARLNNLDSDENLVDQLRIQKTQLNNTLKSAFVTADDVIRNRVDVFIDNPGFRSGSFTIALRDFFLRQEIIEKRHQIELMFNAWNVKNNEINIDNISISDAELVKENLNQILDLLDTISRGSTNFEPIPDITRAQIDAYIAGISTSRTSIANKILEVTRAIESINNIQNQIPLLRLEVDRATASITSLRNISDRYVIRSPFSGVVSSVNVTRGENITSGRSLITLITDSDFEIEVFIPEILISGVEVGNRSNVRFEAFGRDNIFDAVVSMIDPRETIKDGVTTYRTTLNLINSVDNIRSGMTVSVEIITEEIEDVILIPRHIILEDEVSYVKILNASNNSHERREVELGMSNGRGKVIVLSGLFEGDKILVPEI